VHVTTTKAVKVSVLPDAVRREAFAEASRFWGEFYACLTPRRDELFELSDAVLCTDGAVKSAVDLTLLPEHRRGHGAMYAGVPCQGCSAVHWSRTSVLSSPLTWGVFRSLPHPTTRLRVFAGGDDDAVRDAPDAAVARG
jgi:hypothetical protein